MMASLVFSYQAFSVRAWPALGPLRVIKTRTQPGNHDPFGRVPRVRHVVQGSPCPPAWSHTQSCQPGWWVGRGRDKKRKKMPVVQATVFCGHRWWTSLSNSKWLPQVPESLLILVVLAMVGAPSLCTVPLPALRVRHTHRSLRNSWCSAPQCLDGAARPKTTRGSPGPGWSSGIRGPCHLKCPRDQASWKQEDEHRGSGVGALSAPVAAPDCRPPLSF